MRKKSFLVLTMVAALALGSVACGNKATSTATTKATQTTEATTEANIAEATTEADTSVDTEALRSAFTDLLDEIYATEAGSAGSSSRVEAAADTLLAYVQQYGAVGDLQSYSALADELLPEVAEENENGADFYDGFRECLDAVSEAALAKDDSWETDLAYSNVVNGITAALDELAPTDTTEASAEEISEEFYGLLEEIYGTKDEPDSKEDVSYSLLSFTAMYGGSSTVQGYDALAEEELAEMQGEYGDSFYADFRTCFEAVVTTAQDGEEDIETDTNFTNVVNGITTALDALDAQ